MKSPFTDTEQQLKMYLLSHGIHITPGAESAWAETFDGPLSLSEYATTSGVCLRLQGGNYVNAPFRGVSTQTTEARLVFGRGEFYLSLGKERAPVSIIPVPAYHHMTYRDGEQEYPYTDLGVTHTDRIRISPIAGCAWRCTFCDLPFKFRYRKKPLQELMRVIELAVSDPIVPAKHVLISGGTPYPNDEPWFDETCRRILENSPIPVDVMMPARKSVDYPAWLHSIGVNVLYANLEVWDIERAKRIVPNKANLLGREHYLRYIEQAVRVFGVGRVLSLLVFGSAIESIESTLEGVQALVDRGCIPILSPFRPDGTTPLGEASARPASFDEMERVYTWTRAICDRSGMRIRPGPYCVPCQHNVVAFRDDAEFFREST